jgi:hypothetical protein
MLGDCDFPEYQFVVLGLKSGILFYTPFITQSNISLWQIKPMNYYKMQPFSNLGTQLHLKRLYLRGTK